jgi:hypothetical protein
MGVCMSARLTRVCAAVHRVADALATLVAAASAV